MSRAADTLRRAGSRLERRTLVLGLLVATIGATLGLISAAAVNKVPFVDHYQLRAVMPPDAPPLKPGDAVRIGGKRVGSIARVEPGRRAARVTMDIYPRYGPVGRDATVFVRLKSASYLYYLAIDPGDRSRALPEGGTIPQERVAFGTDPLEVTTAFDRATRQAFGRTLVAGAGGLAGRGASLNAAIRDLEPALRQGTPQLDALSPRGGRPGDLVDGATKTMRGLAGERRDDVERSLPALRSTAAVTARRRAELGRTLELLPPLQGEVLATGPLADPLLVDAERLARRLTPIARDLDVVVPEVNALLRTGDELRAETARLTAAADPVLREARPLLEELRPAAASLRPLAESLRPVVVELIPYDRDIGLALRGLLAVGSDFNPMGDPPDNPALRFTPIVCDHRPREPFPRPGEALRQRTDRPQRCSLR